MYAFHVTYNTDKILLHFARNIPENVLIFEQTITQAWHIYVSLTYIIFKYIWNGRGIHTKRQQAGICTLYYEENFV